MPGHTGRNNGGRYTDDVMPTVHDWEEEKKHHNNFYDDGTMTFFWNAHTLTVLVIFTCCLIYVAVFEDPSSNTAEFNTKRGVIAVTLAFLLFGVTQTPDGPFRRPHPAIWRLLLCLSIVYELFLIFLLFQTGDTARKLLKHVDSSLGEPLPEKEYCQNCLLYDPDFPESPFHNVYDKLDGFCITHFLGWWAKSLLLRDYWLCTVLSIMFELMEYTLEHQLPNFCECWWDHWILDILICNGLGIYVGMKTLRYLKMKTYHWSGLWNIHTYRGKIGRLLTQFTPYYWMEFNWRATTTIHRWIAMLGIISVFLLAELNTFYLKFVLWLPPEHYLCLGRLVLILLWGAVGLRETFQYMDDPNCSKFGRQSWMMAAIIISELLVCMKYGLDTILKPIPPLILSLWLIGVGCLVMWTVWHFLVCPLYFKKFINPQLKKTNGNPPPDAATDVKKEASSNYSLRSRGKHY